MGNRGVSSPPRNSRTSLLNEIAITEELYRSVRAYADDHGAVRLQQVKVVVGELQGADVERMRSTWHFVVRRVLTRMRYWRSRSSLSTSTAHCDPVMRMEPYVPRCCPKCQRALHAEGGKVWGIVHLAFETEVADLAGEGGCQ